MQTVTIAVVGIGNMGFAHAACLAAGEISGMTLSAVCDCAEDRVASFLQQHPQVKGYCDYASLLRDRAADAVLIAVPHPMHAQMAQAALEQGFHVLLEKPADVSVSRALKMNAAAEKTDRVFGIMFNQRTNPLFQKAREIVRSGALGELKRTAWTVTNWYRTQYYYDSGDWRATWSGEGGGVLLNQAPHQLDLWQWICGMPAKVTAFCDIAKYHDIEVEDNATVFVRYANGATGTFITSTGEYPGTNRLEIAGDLGKLVLEEKKLKWWRLQENERRVCASAEKNFMKIGYDYEELLQTEKESGHKGILQNFADAICMGEPLIAPGTDGVFELTLSNAAYLSAWEGSREVTLPFDAAAFDEKLAALAETSKKRSPAAVPECNSTYSRRWQVNW